MKYVLKVTFAILVLTNTSCAKSNCYECEAVESGGIIIFETQTICEGDNGWTADDLEAEIMAFEALGSTCKKK